MDLGPKYYNINGLWALIRYYLGPWTLRVGVPQLWIKILSAALGLRVLRATINILRVFRVHGLGFRVWAVGDLQAKGGLWFKKLWTAVINSYSGCNSSL